MKNVVYLKKLGQKIVSRVGQSLLLLALVSTTIMPSPALAQPANVEGNKAIETPAKLEEQRPVVKAESTPIPSVQANFNNHAPTPSSSVDDKLNMPVESNQSVLNSSYLLDDTNTPTNTPVPTATSTSTLSPTPTATPDFQIQYTGTSSSQPGTGSFSCTPALNTYTDTIICTGTFDHYDSHGILDVYGSDAVTVYTNFSPREVHYYVTLSAPPNQYIQFKRGVVLFESGSGSYAGSFLYPNGFPQDWIVRTGAVGSYTGPITGSYTIILSTSPISPPPGFDPETDLYPGSVLYSGGNKSPNGGIIEADGNVSTTACNVNPTCGDPVNPRTGAFSFTQSDLSFDTSAGDLIFQRSYSSGAAESIDGLGYGWTQNHGAKLIFPADPDGLDDYVLFESVLGNHYLFEIQPGDIYEPGPGVLAELTKSGSEYTLTTTDQEIFTFDLDGLLTSREDAQGNEFSYTYDVSDRLTEVSADSGSRYLEIGYDLQDRITSVENHAGQDVTYAYDVAGDLVSFTDVLDQTWTYTYNADHQITEVTDPDNTVITVNEYDTEGRLIEQYDGEENLIISIDYLTDQSSEVTDALGNVTLYEYDERGVFNGMTDDLGNEDTKTSDANFRPTIVTDEVEDTTTLTWSADGKNLTAIEDAEGSETNITYNSLNLPLVVTDALDHETTFTYDGTLLSTVTNELEETTTYAYTSEGYLESVTDPLENTTSYTYDSHGQRISMTDPLNHTWTYAYDSLGRLIDTTDPLLHVTHNVYDAAGRLTSMTVNYDDEKDQNEDNEWNIITTYAYDVRGNQISVTDTLGRTTEYEYDTADRLIKTIDADENETTYTYNDAGQLITVTDALGHATEYEYDEVGRLILTTDELNNTTSTTYNEDGTVASTTDALSNVTFYEYDSLKRVITIILPNDGEIHNTYDDFGNLATTTDPMGNETTYEYDVLNRVIKTTDAREKFTQTFYDEAGRVIETKDARGHSTFYEYDDASRLISITDELENVTTYEYDVLGRPISVTDANENETTYTYDELSRTVAVTNALSHTSTITYDALGQTLARTDANSNSVSFDYNDLGQLISQTDALSNIISFTYDDVGNRLTMTDPNLHTTTIGYDVLNRPITVTDANNNTSSGTYDAAGNLLTFSDGLDNTTTYGYNELNQQDMISDPLDNETQHLYNLNGDLVLTTDAEGVATKYEYDEVGNLTAVIENYQAAIPADSETNVRTEYTYDENGNRLSILDANEHETTFTYDELNRLITETDPLDHTWTTAYDDVGNRISMTDANEVTTYYEYDDANRLVTIDYATGADVTFTYDNGGRRITMTDGLGTTTWTYNELNQVTAITDPFDKTVEYAYDDAGNKIEITYPDLSTVSYEYDDANRLTEVNGFSSLVEYTYDDADRLTLMERPNDIDTAYIYDDANHLSSITHVDGVELLSSFDYLYDNVGNRIQAIEDIKLPEPPSLPTTTPTASPTGTITSTFTPQNTSTPTLTPSETLPPTETHTPINTSTPTETVTLTPSETSTSTNIPSGTRIRMPGWYSSSKDNDFSCDPDAFIYAYEIHCTSITDDTDSHGSQDSYTLNNIPMAVESAPATWYWYLTVEGMSSPNYFTLSIGGNEEIATGGNGVYSGSLTAGSTGNNPFSLVIHSSTDGSYTGPVYAEWEVVFSSVPYTPPTPTGTMTPGETWTPWTTFTPSLTLTPTSTPPGGPVTIDYVYDSLYRLTEANYSNDDFYHYTYDKVGNRLEQQSEVNGLPSTIAYSYDNANRLESVNSVSYTFDANGNLLNDGTNTYTYDLANRLTSISGAQSASYTYNGFGDRLSQTVGSQTTNYVLDLNTGLTQVLDDGTNTYTYGFGRISQTDTTTEYFLGDALGSVRQLTDHTGDITLATSYDPYGTVLSNAGSGSSPFGYTGEQTDPSGLTYLRARYYSSSNGNFISRDTFPGNAIYPASFNHYSYVNNNPIRYTDPSGECFDPASIVICALGGAALAGGGNLAYQLHQNGGNWDCIDWGEVATWAGGGAVAGLVVGLTLPVLLASPDTAMDIASLIYDAYIGDTAAFAMDAAALMIPGVIGMGALSHVDEAYDALRYSDEVAQYSDEVFSYSDEVAGNCPIRLNSFTEDTTVATKDGDTPIAQIQIGDYVLAWDEETGEISFFPVTDTIHHTDEIIVHLTIDGEAITTTLEHPFYVEGKGWVDAKDLQIGDQIRNADESTGEVEEVTTEETTREMYNLTVDKAHTFYVGDGQWLVHNCEDAFDDLAKLRQSLELEDTDVLARFDIDGESFYGKNAPGIVYPRPAGVTFQSLRHAEGDAISQAIASGIRSEEATLFVDTLPCQFCRNSFAGYAKALNLSEFKVYTPEGLYGSYDPITGKFLLALLGY